MKIMTAASLALLTAGFAFAQEPPQPPKGPATPDALRTEIDGLKAAHVAWREIAWKSCLVEGLKESREKKKPVVLWVFIDRPADDARC
jgi:hypothetical protein